MENNEVTLTGQDGHKSVWSVNDQSLTISAVGRSINETWQFATESRLTVAWLEVPLK